MENGHLRDVSTEEGLRSTDFFPQPYASGLSPKVFPKSDKWQDENKTTRDENIQVGNKQIIRRIFAYYLPEHLPPPDIDVGRHI